MKRGNQYVIKMCILLLQEAIDHLMSLLVNPTNTANSELRNQAKEHLMRNKKYPKL